MAVAARSRRSSGSPATWALCLALALGLAQALGQLLAYRYDVARSELDSSADTGVFAVLDTIAFAAAVAAAWIVPLALPRLRRTGLACALLLSAVFVLDTLSPRHALVLAAPAAAGALVLLWRLAPAGSAARRLLRPGCAVLALAFAGHALGAWLVDHFGQGADSWAYQAKVVIKHGGELVGWTLVASGLAALLRGR
jgi:hypothetical protein